MDGVSRVGRVSIEALGGTCCEWPDWQTRDALNIDGIPVVAASDPAWRTAEHGSAAQAGFQLAAPDTRAISVDFDAARRRAVVTGGPGSVPGDAQVLVGTIEMNDYVSVKAGLLGGFEADVAAAPGTHVLVKQDVTGRYVFPESERERFGENVIAPGVLLRLPVEPSSDGIAFGAGARLCCDAVSWAIEGVAESLAAMPGGDLRLRGTVTLHTDPAVRPKQTRLSFDMGLLFDAGGRQVGRAGTFVSPFLTSTGLPIERALEDQPLGRLNLGELDMGQWQTSANGWAATFDGSIRIPADTRDGVYELVAGGMWDLGDSNLELSGMRPLDIVMRNGHAVGQRSAT